MISNELITGSTLLCVKATVHSAGHRDPNRLKLQLFPNMEETAVGFKRKHTQMAPPVETVDYTYCR